MQADCVSKSILDNILACGADLGLAAASLAGTFCEVQRTAHLIGYESETFPQIWSARDLELMTSFIRRAGVAGLCIFVMCEAMAFCAGGPGNSLPMCAGSILRENLLGCDIATVSNDVALNEAAPRETTRFDGEEQNAEPSRSQTARHDERSGDANPTSFNDLVARARAAMAADRLTEAIQLYGLAVRQRPDWAEGWWYLGTLSFDTGRFTEARTAFKRFVDVEKKQPGPGFGMLGLTEFHLKHYRPALAALERGVDLGLGTDPTFVNSVLFHDGILNNLFGLPEIALTRLTLVAN